MSAKERDFLDEETELVEEQPAVEAEQQLTPEPVEKVEEKQPEATTAPEPRKDENVPLPALMAEREKRQKAEAERQRLERELEELRQQAANPAPSFYEAPEQFLQAQVRAVEQSANQRLYAALEAQAREAYSDYDEVFAEVQQHAQDNPVVVQRIFSDANPAVAAYKLGKQLRELKQMQDPEAYRQKVEAEVRAKVEAEYRAKEEAKQKAAAAIPPDLTSSRSAKADEMPPPETVFDEIF